MVWQVDIRHANIEWNTSVDVKRRPAGLSHLERGQLHHMRFFHINKANTDALERRGEAAQWLRLEFVLRRERPGMWAQPPRLRNCSVASAPV